MLDDVLPFNHTAARNNYFKFIDHLADGQLPRNNDNTSNLLRLGNTTTCVIGHSASIVRNDNALLLRRPRQELRIGRIAKADLICRYDIQVGDTKQQTAKDCVIQILINEQPKHDSSVYAFGLDSLFS